MSPDPEVSSTPGNLEPASNTIAPDTEYVLGESAALQAEIVPAEKITERSATDNGDTSSRTSVDEVSPGFESAAELEHGANNVGSGTPGSSHSVKNVNSAGSQVDTCDTGEVSSQVKTPADESGGGTNVDHAGSRDTVVPNPCGGSIDAPSTKNHPGLNMEEASEIKVNVPDASTAPEGALNSDQDDSLVNAPNVSGEHDTGGGGGGGRTEVKWSRSLSMIQSTCLRLPQSCRRWRETPTICKSIEKIITANNRREKMCWTSTSILV